MKPPMDSPSSKYSSSSLCFTKHGMWCQRSKGPYILARCDSKSFFPALTSFFLIFSSQTPHFDPPDLAYSNRKSFSKVPFLERPPEADPLAVAFAPFLPPFPEGTGAPFKDASTILLIF